MPADRDMITFAADRGALVAFSTTDAPPPYESKVQRADPTAKAWRTVYTSDSHFMAGTISAGRVALIEYRQPLQGEGAFSHDLTVVDLDSGRPITVDHVALSKATFRGGGGAPRRPNTAVALGPDRIAWTRMVEGPGGSITGELYLASLADPSRPQKIGTSGEWIAPLAVDTRRLVYVLGGKTQDELHVRDLASGADRIAARATVGDTAIVGSPGMSRAAIAGTWALWVDLPPAPTTKGGASFNATIHALDLGTGTERTFDAGGSNCPKLSVGTRYVTWYCGSLAGPIARVYDAVTLEPVAGIPPGRGVGVEAVDDGAIWFELNTDGRTVTLYRPR
jgi:hypothetical protein